MTHSKNHDKKLPKKNPGKYGKSLTFFTKKAFSDLWHTRKLWRKGDFWSFGDFRNCSITHPKWVGSCWTAFLLGSCLFCFTTAGLAKPGSWRVSSNSGGEWRFPPGWTTSCKRLVSGWLIPVYVRIMISLHSEPSWIMCYKRHSKMPTDWRFFSILLPFWLWESKPVFFFVSLWRFGESRWWSLEVIQQLRFIFQINLVQVTEAQSWNIHYKIWVGGKLPPSSFALQLQWQHGMPVAPRTLMVDMGGLPWIA